MTMTETIRMPVRVLVKGASDVIYTTGMSGPRSDFAWPRVIEAELYSAGWPAEVRSLVRPGELAKEFYPTWRDEVLAWSPDVVVLDYGGMECVHLFLPRSWERHANSLAGRPQPLRLAYRSRIVKPVWRFAFRLQRAVDTRLPRTSKASQWRLRRGIRDIDGLITHIRKVASPLVLIPEIPLVGKPYRKWFPGANDRIAIANEMLQDLVRKYDSPEVMFVPLSHLFEHVFAEGKDARPDGGHYTPEGHRIVGEEVGRLILEWVEKQPHLSVEPKVDRR
jgi:hypothetical protein